MDLTRMPGSVRNTAQGACSHLHGHAQKALAETTVAMMVAGHCQLSHLELVGVSRAKVPGRGRRWPRANSRLAIKRALNSWAHWALSGVGEVRLILDKTPKSDQLRVMKLCRQIRSRTIPLSWHCHRPDALPMVPARPGLELAHWYGLPNHATERDSFRGERVRGIRFGRALKRRAGRGARRAPAPDRCRRIASPR
jgi:hypothetical protein